MTSLSSSPRLAIALTAALLAFLGLGLLVAEGFAADEDKGVLADLISRALSTPTSSISIGGIDGALSSDATVRDIKVADRDGVWVTVNRIRIVWRRLALLQRRLEIDKLDIDQINIARKPVPSDAPVAGEDRPLLPELPVTIEIKQFSLARVDLGEAVLGVASVFSTGGNAKLGPPSEGLQLFLDGQRLDRPATLNVRLNLVPDGQRLNCTVHLDEPAGGILSHLANIPGQPAVKFDIGGTGTLDAFNAKLAFAAGPGIGATGDASVNREGAARRLGLDLAAEVSGLLPEMAAPVISGTTRLSGNVIFGDDGAIAIPGIGLTAAAAKLDIKGGLTATHIADVRITAANVLNGGGRTAIRDAEIGRLALDAHLTGSLDLPTLDSALEVEDTRLPSVSLGRLDASFKATPTESIANTSTLLQLAADAKVTGLKLENPSLAQAIGNEASLTMRGSSTIRGLVDFEALDLKSQTIAAHFKGRVGGPELKGQLNVEAADLSRFSALAGVGLKGSATVAADVEGTPRANRFSANIDVAATRFATGIAPIDGLFGGKLTLGGGVKLDPDGGFGFRDLRLAGPNANAQIDGAATPKLADINGLVIIPDLSKADKRMTGRGDLMGHLTGTSDRPDSAAKISITNASMLGRPVPRLDIVATATNLKGALDAKLTLAGEIGHRPAQGALHVARPLGGGFALDGVDVAIGSVGIKGALALDAANFAAGQFSIHARDLDDVSPLVLEKLFGAIDADITLSHGDGGQDARLIATGQRVEALGIGFDKLVADLAVSDLYRHPVIAGSVAVDQARAAGETITTIRVNAKGGAQASDVTLTAVARGFNLDARAQVVPANPVRIEISKFDAVRGKARVGLAEPAIIALADGGADLRSFALNLCGGRLTLIGRVGSKLDLKANARAIPLSVGGLIGPDLALGGTLDGEASISGAVAAPSGPYRIRIAKLVAPQTKAVGIPPLDVNATGRLEGARATLETTIAATQAGTLRVVGSVPLSANGVLDLVVKGNLDASLANRSMSASGRRVTGALAIDARVGGAIQNPQASGSATLSNGSFQDALIGARLDAIRARLVAHGNKITIESASAVTRNGGSLTVAGDIKLDPAGGFPGTLKIKGKHAELVQSALATAVADLDLDVAGPLARYPRLGGKVDIGSLDVSIPERLPGSLQPLPGTRHIDPTPTAAARLAIAAKTAKGGKRAPAFNAALDLTITAPNAIRVHGRGLDAQLGGNLKLAGTLAEPKPVGAFNLVQGSLRILTSQLDFTRANLTFAGDLSPQLDFLATTQAGGATITVAITGDPADPQFIFTSSPDMPQDEILSRLLFGAPSGQLSPTQALALAQAAAIYSGGNDALEGLRRSLGLGDASNSNNPLTKFLGDRVSLGVHTGATPAQTGVGMNISVYKRLKAKGSIDASGGASVGVGAEYEW
ncbi:MAG: translocation/assembly module TamB domain-containing protein [Methylocella sp.]